MTAAIVNANALALPLASGTVQTVVTSPPYYGLRDYGIEGQIGLEQTPEEYVAKMVQVFREVKRVLRDDGTLWLNLGDSFWGGKGASSQAWSTEHQDRDTLQKGYHQISGKGETRPTDGKHPVIKPKDLIGIPWRVAFALQADGWYLRCDIIWHKPNPMPESVKDRPTRAHEYVFLLSKSARYYYDAEAVREEAATPLESKSHQRFGAPGGKVEATPGKKKTESGEMWVNDGQRNRRSVWTIATQPTPFAHFATMPEKLVEPCILAGSRAGDWVLDPFMGSGTVAKVAMRLGRKAFGAELNFRYIRDIASRRTAGVQMMALPFEPVPLGDEGGDCEWED